MTRGNWRTGLLLLLASLLMVAFSVSAESIDQLVADAKKEGELNLMAGARTFGGAKGFSELQEKFNQKFGLDAKISLTRGPSMPAMAARVLTEQKANTQSSTDFYLGSISHFVQLSHQNALETVNWSGLFPWITKQMEIIPGHGVLVYTSPQGIIYNSNLVPKEKAPKRYEELVDPALSPTWAGKLAIPPYPDWLSELTLLWGEERVKEFTPRLVALSGGRLRYSEYERVFSGEFYVMANLSDALQRVWKWQPEGAPVAAAYGSMPMLTYYFMLGVPKNSAHPSLAKLFVAFMLSKDAQSVLEKYDVRSSHLVKGTKMQDYLRENDVELLDVQKLVNFYQSGEGPRLQKEFAKMLRR